MDTREELLATVKAQCGVDLTVTARAEAAFSSTNRMLDTVYDTAIDGVACLFAEAKRSKNTVSGCVLQSTRSSLAMHPHEEADLA